MDEVWPKLNTAESLPFPPLPRPEETSKENPHITEELFEDKRYFVCSCCGKSSILKATVERHIKTVHAPKLNLKCQVCGVVYKNQPSFQDHLRRKKCYDSQSQYIE